MTTSEHDGSVWQKHKRALASRHEGDGAYWKYSAGEISKEELRREVRENPTPRPHYTSSPRKVVVHYQSNQPEENYALASHSARMAARSQVRQKPGIMERARKTSRMVDNIGDLMSGRRRRK